MSHRASRFRLSDEAVAAGKSVSFLDADGFQHHLTGADDVTETIDGHQAADLERRLGAHLKRTTKRPNVVPVQVAVDTAETAVEAIGGLQP